MLNISSSPDRYTFDKQIYLKNITEENETPDPEILKMIDLDIYRREHKFDNAELCKNNMEYDLVTTAWILAKTRASDSYAQNIYAAICNNDFQKTSTESNTWSASWRSAGGIVADMQQKGDYIDWYCSGIGAGLDAEGSSMGHVPEGCVTDEIKHDLQQLGWVLVPGGDWEQFLVKNCNNLITGR